MWLTRRTHATLDHRQGRGGWDNTNTTREAKPGQRPPHKITSTGTFRGFTLLWDMITLRPTLLDVPRFHLGFPFIHIKPTNTASSLRGHYLYMHELVLYHEPCGSRDAHMQLSTTDKGEVGGTTPNSPNKSAQPNRVTARRSNARTGTMIASRLY